MPMQINMLVLLMADCMAEILTHIHSLQQIERGAFHHAGNK